MHHEVLSLRPGGQIERVPRRNADQQQRAIGCRPRRLPPMPGGEADKFGERIGMRVAKGKPDTDRNHALVRRMNPDHLGRPALRRGPRWREECPPDPAKHPRPLPAKNRLRAGPPPAPPPCQRNDPVRAQPPLPPAPPPPTRYP